MIITKGSTYVIATLDGLYPVLGKDILESEETGEGNLSLLLQTTEGKVRVEAYDFVEIQGDNIRLYNGQGLIYLEGGD